MGCHEPGYSVRIHVNKDAKVTENTIQSIKSEVLGTSFEEEMIKKEDSWKVESFRIPLDGDSSENIKHKYIIFVLECYYAHNEKSLNNAINYKLEKLDIRIGNPWEGKKPALKKEIDKIADTITNILSKNFDQSSFTIERKFVNPM